MTLQERLRELSRIHWTDGIIGKVVIDAADALDAKDERIREYEAATGYAQRLAIAMAKKFYPEVPQWEPLDDLSGILTQIDNMTSGLERAREALK